jgi:glycosyltransferase involved in cell wall biosynthesis
MAPTRRLLTIGHSYCVTLNRRLADAIAKGGTWEVTAVGPARFRGDFGWHDLVAEPGEACEVMSLPVHFGSRVATMMYGGRLRRLLRQPWDVVHCWEEPYVAAAAQVAMWTPRRTPLVFSTFQNIAKWYPPPFNFIEQYAMSRAQGVIAFGETILDVLRERGFSRVPVRVIPPGVDLSTFAPDPRARLEVREALGWPESVPVVGFVGRLVPQKGIHVLTTVLDRLAVPWRALFVGTGPLESTLRAWIGRHPGRAVLQSTVKHDEVGRFLNAMDILAAPSQTTNRWREQFGRMLIEAMACGVPVVASDSGEIPHVVGNAGLLVREDDLDAWQVAIERLLSDSDRRQAFSREGRCRVGARYAWPVIARQHEEFFESLI